MTIVKDLLNWYNFNKRDLPWRKNKDPYRVWISEIILQQTRISKGEKYFNDFINNFPTINDLADASQEEVLKQWEGLGYYNRAINLHETSKFIVNKLNSNLPKSYDDLIKLKGIGEYTASAISSICFNKYNSVVDGNVLRFLSRLYGIRQPIDSLEGKKKIKEISSNLIVKTENPGDFNQAMMEFGSLVCSPFPYCETCIFKSKCLSFINREVELIPVKSKKKSTKTRYLNYLVLRDIRGRTIINQRVKKDIWFRLYQFPLIETDILINSIHENHEFIDYINKNKLELKKIGNSYIVKHILTHQTLFISFHLIYLKEIINNSTEINNLKNYTFPVPISNFISKYLT